MTRYFFDIHDGIDVRDEVGVELFGIEEARAHAIRRAADFVAELDGNGQGGYVVVTIRDAASTVLSLRLVCQFDTTGRSATAYLDAVRKRAG